MFWSIVLPFQIAAALSFLVIFPVYSSCRRSGMSRSRSASIGVCRAVLTFIPLVFVASYAADYFRFGRFQAVDAGSTPFRVRQYLPPEATNIDMITTQHDHNVRFRIAEEELVVWMNRLWSSIGDRSPMPRAEAAFGATARGKDDPDLVQLGMNPDQRFTLYEGPYQGDWGGPTLWYDAASETAWQRVGYW